jgi:hypothetical protein
MRCVVGNLNMRERREKRIAGHFLGNPERVFGNESM